MPHRLKLHALLALVAVCLPAAGQGIKPFPDAKQTEKELARAKDGLALTLRTDKTEYQPGEGIILEVKIRNVSGTSPFGKPRDVHVYFEPFARDREGAPVPWLFRFHVREGKTGRLVYRSPEADVRAEERDAYYHFVTLPPQAFVGRSFVFSTEGLEPGQSYSLAVDYAVSKDYPYVIRNREFTAEQVQALGVKRAYVRVWTGRITSNRVVLRIQPKPPPEKGN